MLGAHTRPARVTFQRAIQLRSEFGVMQDAAWSGIGTRFASVRWGSSAERREAAAEGSVQSATFRLLVDSLTRTITARDRIIHDGATWDIEGVVRIGRGQSGEEVEFTCKAARG